ncbi:alkaline-phosphatase-like protein [Stachybotrys elegans]|uniref:GPI ethanolamine phosphate transferase 2 n=1 Tax=Stachybotrys elegans TaxID=80388 RepID=A0A8K0SHG0_9HYPO|nr:alkaline-phosphatase-like protein [Stachybotrys elegans]
MVAVKNGSLQCTLFITIANLLIPLSIVIFAVGFFPYKPFLPGLAEFETLEYGPPPAAPFDKLVFMVVDALRSDFVYAKGSGFEYTQSLIRDGSAIPFTANARSPTVTMPRIKSITTGSIPSFVDLILNFDEEDTSSTLAAQDTWLAQLKANQLGKLLMFGDDTWLKLFPDTFDRYDGTSSFFVADFTEVDNNVTRNIAGELENNDWGLMVLHYLGLDHIGHKSGPRSPNMVPKQREMDGIVQTIHEAMMTQQHLASTLLVLCGDHGMNDAGNHGASSPGETSPALVFLSPKLKDISSGLQSPAEPKDDFEYYTMVEQSDIAPTIAALLGFPVSKNNLGTVIPDFLSFWPSSRDKIQILIRNARQILNIVTAAFGHELFEQDAKSDPCAMESGDVSELACGWRRINHQASVLAAAGELDQAWLTSTSAWLRKAQDLMSSMASNYDMPMLFLGQSLSLIAVVASGMSVATQGTHTKGSMVPLFLISILYGIMMFASSYVEEEHHFWYWASTLWLACLAAQHIQRTKSIAVVGWYVLSLASLRLVRGWNQTGQKYAGEPDIVKLFLVRYPELLWVLVGSMYIFAAGQILPNLSDLPFLLASSITAILASVAFSFKLAFTAEDAPELVVGFAKALSDTLQGQSLLVRARLVFFFLSALYAFAIYRALSRRERSSASTANLLHQLYTILAMTQSRAANIPLFLLSNVLLHSLSAAELSVTAITTTSILFQYTFFFAFGGSNAISSVDLSSAYNGISGYNVIAVGLLTLISNWAGPIFWTSATNLLLLQKYRQGDRLAFRHHLALLTLFTTLSVAFVMAACTALRTHLFIWTVFSPKYLYCMAWSLGQHLMINVGFGGLLFWLTAQELDTATGTATSRKA